MPKQSLLKKWKEAAEEKKPSNPSPGHPTWSGSISIGLVNIPVRAIPITIE